MARGFRRIGHPCGAQESVVEPDFKTSLARRRLALKLMLFMAHVR